MLKPNPFVGPQPLTREQRVFGREREVIELLHLLTAQRILLVHSPSGAGKSSLINASGGLIDKLEDYFVVWPPTRVNLPQTATNRYVWSAIQGFQHERGIPNPPSTLCEYVQARRSAEQTAGGTVLIFDQFEEVLRLDPLDIAEKREFFRQLGDLLRDPLVWAVFLLREDYLAPLDAYRHLIPTHLNNRYRIMLLDAKHAEEAIRGTANEGGRSFGAGAAERLIEDLAAGNHVEPMQLQVVCHTLWQDMPADDLTIDLDTVQRFGNVTTALSQYYATAVSKIAGDDAGLELTLRDWIGETLITPEGARGQVQQGSSQCLEKELIQKLVDAHLVRADSRGSIWFELAHDRLIRPVLENNEEFVRSFDLARYYGMKVTALAAGDMTREQHIREWVGRLITAEGLRTRIPSDGVSFLPELLAAHLVRLTGRSTPQWVELPHDRWVQPVLRSNKGWMESRLTQWERRALQWEQEQEPQNLLLVDEDLKDARQWLEPPAQPMVKVDRFLAACKARQAVLNHQRRSRRWLQGALVLASALAVTAGYGLYDARQQRNEARDNLKKFQEKDAEAKKAKEEARQASKRAEKQAREARQSKELATISEQLAASSAADAKTARALSKDSTRQLLAARLAAQSGLLATTQDLMPSKLLTLVESLRLSPDSNVQDTLRVVLMFAPNFRVEREDPVSAATIIPGTETPSLLTLSATKAAFVKGGRIAVFDINKPAANRIFTPAAPPVALALSNDSAFLAVAEARTVKLFRTGSRDELAAVPVDADVVSLAVGPRGSLVVAVHASGASILNMVNKSLLLRAQAPTPIRAVAVGPDLRVALATATGLQIFTFNPQRPTSNSFKVEPDITGLAYSTNGRYISAARTGTRGDRQVEVHRVDDMRRMARISFNLNPEIPVMAFGPGDDNITVMLFSQGKFLFPYRLLEQKDLMAAACFSAGRNLTLEEWRIFMEEEEPRRTCPNWPEPE